MNESEGGFNLKVPTLKDAWLDSYEPIHAYKGEH